MELITIIGEEIENELSANDGYLNIGRVTANGEREIFFCLQGFS